MYYVVRTDKDLSCYHYIFEKFLDAKDSCINLKNMFGYQYKVVKVETVWTTQTLAEIIMSEIMEK
jgi:hypothetical protein